MDFDGEEPKLISHIHLHVECAYLGCLNIELKFGVVGQASGVLEFTLLETFIVKRVSKVRRCLIAFPDRHQQVPWVIHIRYYVYRLVFVQLERELLVEWQDYQLLMVYHQCYFLLVLRL